MAFQFLSPELSRWDTLAPGEVPELLVLPFFVDERPLRGAAGLVDWRMHGKLSALLVGGRVSGARDEATLLPARRIAFQRLLLYGLGDAERFDEARYCVTAPHLADVARKLGARRYALSLPGRSTGRLAARRALELWLTTVGDGDDVWLVEEQAAQKDLSELLGRRR